MNIFENYSNNLKFENVDTHNIYKISPFLTDKLSEARNAYEIVEATDFLVAYLLTSICKKCEQCGTTKTPQWRKGWFSDVLRKKVSLCNACGLKYNNNQYCQYCNYIYRRSDNHATGDRWVVCNGCTRWAHRECEKEHTGIDVGECLYCCPSCVIVTANFVDNQAI